MPTQEGRAYCTAGQYFLDETSWTGEGQGWKRNVYKQCRACVYYTIISCPTFNSASTVVVRNETYRETKKYLKRIYPPEKVIINKDSEL
jgi:hypothetical protein